MSIELEKTNCPYGNHHDMHPIIEGNETVGLVCQACGKSVREDMTRTEIVANGDGTITGMTFMIQNIYRGKRKDPRF